MSTPLRVNDALFKEAETEGSLMNRSTAKQVEFWAELGGCVAPSISPADMLALMQGIAQGRLYYEASKNKPGLLDQVMPDGQRLSGRFSDGLFVPE